MSWAVACFCPRCGSIELQFDDGDQLSKSEAINECEGCEDDECDECGYDGGLTVDVDD